MPRPGEGTRKVARLTYPSLGADPEPYAWTRFARFFQWETRAGLDVQTVDVKGLTPGAAPIAVLTGTVRYDFTDADVAATRAYVEAGGVLLVDACGGQEAFAKSVDALLAKAFPGAAATPLTATSPVLVPSRPGAGRPAEAVLRPFAVEKVGKEAAATELAWGKGRVIFSRLDLTTGLLGTESWGIVGYDPAYAQALVKNAILWADARARELP